MGHIMEADANTGDVIKRGPIIWQRYQLESNALAKLDTLGRSVTAKPVKMLQISAQIPLENANANGSGEETFVTSLKRVKERQHFR